LDVLTKPRGTSLAFSPRRLPDLKVALLTMNNVPALIAVFVIVVFGMFAD